MESFNRSKGVVLGMRNTKDPGEAVTLNPENPANNNIAVIGGSGSGKTRSYALPEILRCIRNEESFVCVCTECILYVEQYELTKKYLEEHGYNITIVNFFDDEEYMKSRITFGDRISPEMDPSKAKKYNKLEYAKDYANNLIIQKTAVFVLVNKLHIESRIAGSAFCSQLYGELIRLKQRFAYIKEIPPVNIIFDAFLNLGYMEPCPEYQSFAQMLRQAMCLDIRTHLLMLSVSQMQDIYKTDWKELFESCKVTVYFGVDGDITAKYISDLTVGKTGISKMSVNKILRYPLEKMIVFAGNSQAAELYKIEYSKYL